MFILFYYYFKTLIVYSDASKILSCTNYEYNETVKLYLSIYTHSCSHEVILALLKTNGGTGGEFVISV